MSESETKQQLLPLIRQMFRFGIVGFSNVVFGYAMYSLFLTIFRRLGILAEFDYLVAQALEFVVGVLWSFYWNNRFVFVEKRTKKQLILALLKSYVMYFSTGLILSSALLVLWIRVFGISAYIAPIINLVITVPLNFLLSKFWVYRKK